MYTQCPECETAFRVTAPLLQQGAGHVVCHGCGITFNALERLTEDAPESAHDDSRAMLDSLEELTGPHEIRIEDTGVEWRVIDEEDVEDGLEDGDNAQPEAEAADPDATGSVRWYIDDELAEDLETLHASVTSADDEQPAGPENEAPGSPLPVPPEPALQDSLPLPVGDTDGVQRYDDNTPLPENFYTDTDQDPPRRRAEDLIEPRTPEADEAQVDLALGEPDEWMELLGEVDTAAPGNEPEQEREPSTSFPSDIDTQFDLQAIELGIDTTGTRPATNEQDLATDGLPEFVATAAVLDEVDADGWDATGEGDDEALVAPHEEHPDEPVADAGMPPEPATDDEEERLRELAFERELASAYEITLDGEPLREATGAESSEPQWTATETHVVPPPTDEEMTINLLIDQDLIRLAEQEGFATQDPRDRRDDTPHVETIIMEGEFVRNALEAELLSQQAAEDAEQAERIPRSADGAVGAASAAADRGDDRFRDTYVTSRDTGNRSGRSGGTLSYRLVAGIALLTMLLATQVVHAYRESLATWPVFDKTLGSVYRLLKEPLHPDWNVRQWQFEMTSGQTDEAGDVLEISSRVANASEQAMPFPLLHVSLTDRFEEIIGSAMIEPRDYLPEGVDAAGRLPAGERFSATLRLASPSPDATGFKLNVCYRESAGRVRCAIEAFRD